MPIALALLALLRAEAADVVVFGDSWAAGGGDELEDALWAAGHRYTLENYGVAGSTATMWNDAAPNALVDAVTLNPGARWVWLSILGNDTFGYHASGKGPTAASLNDAELREMLDRLHAAHPDVQVVGFAYDYPNFERSTDCVLTAAAYFPDLVSAGQFSTWAVNRIFETEIRDVQAGIDADHPRYRAYDLYGTLQGGVPNPLLPSPSSRMTDCIHPTSQGYRMLHDELVAAYWGHAAPTAAIGGAPTGPVCAGTPLVLTDASRQADGRLWSVDGVEVGVGSTLPLTPAGITDVRLRAYGGAWHADATAHVVVVPPPTAAATADATTVCAGHATTLRATGGRTYAWSPTTGLSSPTSPTPLATPTATTTWTVTVADAGCTATAEVTVEVLPAPAVTVDGPGAAEADAWIDVAAVVGDGVSVRWSADGGATVEADAATARVRFPTGGAWTVTATATGADGCDAAATLDVAVTGPPPDTDAPHTDDIAAADTDAGGAGGGAGGAWDPDPVEGCGCALGTSPGGAAAPLLLAWLARRRRGVSRRSPR